MKVAKRYKFPHLKKSPPSHTSANNRLDFHPNVAAYNWVMFYLISQIKKKKDKMSYTLKVNKAKSHWPPSELVIFLLFVLKYIWHCISLGCKTVIWYVSVLWNDHHNKFSKMVMSITVCRYNSFPVMRTFKTHSLSKYTLYSYC